MIETKNKRRKNAYLKRKRKLPYGYEYKRSFPFVGNII